MFNFEKKVLVCALFAGMTLSTAASAACPGFYIGGQLGYGNTHYGLGDTVGLRSANVKNTGLAGRVFVGYQFNENWAAELGYTQFSRTKFTRIVTTAGTTLADGAVKQNATDLVAKGMLPLDNGFGLYAKAGIAYVNASTDGGLSTQGGARKTRPTAGIGASYDFNPNLVGDISWTRIFKGGSIQNADLAAVGLAYHFG